MSLRLSTISGDSLTGMPRFRQLVNVDWLAVILMGILLTIGVVFIYGAGVELGSTLSTRWTKQLTWIFVGTAVYITAAAIDYRMWCRSSWFFYLCGLGVLLFTLFFGKTWNSTRGWLQLPGIGLVQTAEAVKPVVLMFLAYLGTAPALRHTWFREWGAPLVLAAAAALPMALIMLQPDFGTAMVFAPLTLALIYLTGLHWKWFLVGGLALLLAIPLIYPRLNRLQQDRIKVFAAEPANAVMELAGTFMDEEAAAEMRKKYDSRFKPGNDWNAIQSKLAVGSGGLTGKGYLQGRQHILGYLPRTIAPTDFIFAVIAEESGFIGAGTVIALLAGVILCFCRTALTAIDEQGTFLAMGATVVFSTHIIINIAMTIGAAPIVGIPLPFLSYGGSFVISTMFLAGLIQSVQIHRYPLHENLPENIL